MDTFILEPGNTISHFRLERKLGEGGMGAVYLAEDLTLARQVAIKFMNRALISSQSALIRDTLEQRFIREARSAAAINHPNVAQIYEASFADDTWYIAMEFIDGQDLTELLESEGVMPIDDIYDIARQTVTGLKFAWENHKILHRDIKPHNLMRTAAGILKIVDLGLAKPVLAPDEQEAAINLTCDGIAVGTPQYMAPEQAAGEPILDCRVDIYSLGATLYELVTGRKSFAASSPALIYNAQMCRDYTNIPELRPDAPAALVDLIQRMLEPKQAVRVSDYDEILAALNEGGAPIAVPASQAAPTFKRPEHDVDDLLLGRYRILKHLGASRAGVAFLCLDTELKVECVVKSLVPDREFPAGEMEMIKNNFQNLIGMAHPNLVQIRDLRREDNGELLVVMERLEGINLREYTHLHITRNGRLMLEEALPVLQRVAAAIDAVNRMLASTHNDIKPESIFLVNDCTEVKLLDYGITARPLANSSTSSTRAKPAEPMPLESPDYMAPEKWVDGAITTLADQYSLGVIVYEMLSRRLPFWLNDPRHEPEDVDDPVERRRQLLANLRQEVLETRPALLRERSPAVNAVLFRALAKVPEERFPDSTSFIAALAKAARGGLGRARVLLIAAAVAALAVLGYLAADHFFLSPGSSAGGAPRPPPVQPDVPVVDPTPAARQAEAEAARQREEAAKRRAAAAQKRLQAAAAREAEAKRQQQEEARRRAEAEAKRRAEAEAEARQQAELRRKQQADLARFQAAYRETHDRLQALPDAAKFLKPAEDQARAAGAVSETDALTQCVAAWQKAVARLADAEDQLTRHHRRQAAVQHQAVAAFHKKVKRWSDWDPEIGERLVDFDVTFAMARDLRKQEDFAKALAHYGKCSKILSGIEKLVQARYTPAAGKDFLVGRVRLEMVWIPAMKCWVGKYEVTNGQFRRFKPRHSSKQHEGLSMNKDNQPACWLSYFDAVAFCAWLNNDARMRGALPKDFSYRLPTKKEWQTFAACGKPNRKYPWGDDWPPKSGNFADQEMFPTEWKLNGYTDDHPVTCPVEKSGANKWGLFGVAGNLWEWTTEKKGDNRAVFGGAWSSCDRRLLEIELKGNNFADPQDKYDNVGFRVLLAPAAEK